MDAVETTQAADPSGAEAAPESGPAADAVLLTPPQLPADPPPIPVRPRPIPVGEGERFDTLDVVRGMALCGILLVNMENFAMVREARYDPLISGGTSDLDYLVWQITFLFADTKFIAIFTMLFGAGIAMANQRRRERGQRGAWAVHYRRMFFLLAIGAAHGLFLWRGDILYFYAFWGLILYFAPRIPTILLIIAGFSLYAWYAVGLDVELWGRHFRSIGFAEQLLSSSGGYSIWELHIFLGSWRVQYEYRLESLPQYLFEYPVRFGNHLAGLMFVGMALFKMGWLSGRWHEWSYVVLTTAALASGAWLVVDSTQFGGTFEDIYAAEQFIWGSLLLTFGYIGLAITLTKRVGLRFGLGGFAALGRMAFTNYLMQSVICTTIFYGYGFGQFEHRTRTEQAGIVVAIWIFQVLFSVVWLRIFSMGPLEWVWRSFSYLRFQPILRRRRLADDSPAVP